MAGTENDRKVLGLAEIAADEVRSQLGELTDRVLQGERIVITRHGRPVVGLVSIDDVRRLQEPAPDTAAA